ncbi:META domain-containing protein [Campylobacter sp.]|uniref:META domain-containing protein n=1 Tax=Campylobacter sp. TaxID=205 RepID=UPI0026DD28B9|nr:META domain-containing protein [Campylobacter sp.]MDO4674148.1 META domain-containing protein [Campylobacter sp.]
MKKFLMPLLFLAFLMGCAKEPTNLTQNQAQISVLASLVGQNLKIEKIILAQKELRAEGAEEGASINFEKDKFYGSSGCNRFFGAYESDGENVQIDGAAATQMLCQPRELMDFESALLTHFKGNFKLSREGGKILLKSEEMSIYLQ